MTPEHLLKGLTKSTAAELKAKDLVHSSSDPDRLYHFTDTQGLVGILRSGKLWASLADALNDESEIRYLLGIASRVINSGALKSVPAAFQKRVAYYLNPENPRIGPARRVYAFVVSFCADADQSAHWLHYGRSGVGCALEFDASKLVISQMTNLLRVNYSIDRAETGIAAILRSVWQFTNEHDIRPDSPDPAKKMLYEIAAIFAAESLYLTAPSHKHTAFSSEREFRLVTRGVYQEGDSPTPGPLELEFRTVVNRLVPYLSLPYDRIPITGVILGNASPLQPAEPAVWILGTEFGGLKFSRSKVRVRP